LSPVSTILLIDKVSLYELNQEIRAEFMSAFDPGGLFYELGSTIPGHLCASDAVHRRTHDKRRMTLAEMLNEPPKAANVGTKKNRKGHKKTWAAYKLNLVVAYGQIPRRKEEYAPYSDR
jgi:hypothetical protein